MSQVTTWVLAFQAPDYSCMVVCKCSWSDGYVLGRCVVPASVGIISPQFCFYSMCASVRGGVVGGACDAVRQLLGALHLLHSSKWTDRFTGRPQAWPCATGLCSSTYENWDWLKPPSVTSLCVAIHPVSNTCIHTYFVLFYWMRVWSTLKNSKGL